MRPGSGSQVVYYQGGKDSWSRTKELWEEGRTAQGDDWLIDSVSLCRGCLVFSGSYAWSNFTILALGLWAVAQRDSVDAIGMVSRERWWERGQGTGSSHVPPHLCQSPHHNPPFSVLKPYTQASQDGEPLAGLAKLPTSAVVFAKTDIGWKSQNPKIGYPPRQPDLLQGRLLGRKDVTGRPGQEGAPLLYGVRVDTGLR